MDRFINMKLVQAITGGTSIGAVIAAACFLGTISLILSMVVVGLVGTIF